MAEYLIDKAYLTALGSILRKKLDIPYQVDFNRIISDLNNLNTETFNASSSSMTINRTGDLYTIQDKTLSNLANAIRGKSSWANSNMTPHEMIDAVNELKVIYKNICNIHCPPDNTNSATVTLDSDTDICCRAVPTSSAAQGRGFSLSIYNIDNQLVTQEQITLHQGTVCINTKIPAGTYCFEVYLDCFSGHAANLLVMEYR